MKSNNRRIKREVTIKGLATSPGIAIGPVYIFRPSAINVSELEVKIDDVVQEFELFEGAIKQVFEQLDYAQHNSEAIYEDQFLEIFESQKAFLQDPILINEIKQEITKTNLSAAYAISKILSKKSEYFISLENTYFRERAYDIMDLKQKLINALLGIDIDYHLSSPSIVVAEMLSPTDTIHFNRKFILGFLTDKGGKTSHAAIMARGLRIPAVVNRYRLSKILLDSDEIIIDGFEGNIIINPTAETRDRFIKIQKDYEKFEAELLLNVKQEAVTRDTHKVELLANLEFAHEISTAKQNGAEGIGLFRTEGLFIEKQADPSEDEQFHFYRQLAEQMNPNQVTIRTVDLGGDKLLDGYSSENELNPFLGWRAIRFCLDKPGLFKKQLRAIYRASHYGNLQILLPMISSVDEIIHTKKIIEEVKLELRQRKIPFKEKVPLGIMIETPAAAISAKLFAAYVDFFSIGTNDLTQYILAIDRTNEKVSKSYNTFNPAVLNTVALSIKAAIEARIEVTLCGEFAATPQAIPLLLGMGLRRFSMNPFYIAEAKKIIRAIYVKDCEKLFRQIRKFHTAAEIEAHSKDYLKKNVPDLKYLR